MAKTFTVRNSKNYPFCDGLTFNLLGGPFALIDLNKKVVLAQGDNLNKAFVAAEEREGFEYCNNYLFLSEVRLIQEDVLPNLF